MCGRMKREYAWGVFAWGEICSLIAGRWRRCMLVQSCYACVCAFGEVCGFARGLFSNDVMGMKGNMKC